MKSLIKKILTEAIKRKEMVHHLNTMGIHGVEAEEALDDLIYYVKNLPNTVRLYRIVAVDKKGDIDTTQPGSHYSIDKESLLNSHTYLTGYGEKYYLITVTAPKSLIDVNQTIINNILYPNENEITLKNKGKGVKISTIKKILKEEIENDYSWLDDYFNRDPLEQVKEFIFNKLKDCELLPSERKPGWTKYVDKNGDILFADKIDTGDELPFLYADYDKIWEKCVKMGCSYTDFKKICKDMLYEIHKRKVTTIIPKLQGTSLKIYETHKR